MPKLYAEVKYQRVLLRLFENQSDHSKPMIMKTKAVWHLRIEEKSSKDLLWKKNKQTCRPSSVES